jgi:hypothetical protein
MAMDDWPTIGVPGIAHCPPAPFHTPKQSMYISDPAAACIVTHENSPAVSTPDGTTTVRECVTHDVVAVTVR